jgi:hypothetical protein
MNRQQIINLVRAKMDEINPLDNGQTVVDPQIDAQLDNSAVSLLELLPSVLAHPVSDTTAPEVQNLIPNKSVDVVCPADFLRLHRLRLNFWDRALTTLLPAGHPVEYRQDYYFIRANPRRPVGILYNIEGRDTIVCYPAPTGLTLPDIHEFVYVKRPAYAQDLPDALIDMLGWHAAALIYSIHGQGEFASLANSKLTEMIQTKLKYRS